jgi:integrase
MAKIEKFHVSSCSGDSCECLWELDYRPLGLRGPRRRVRFRTRKHAERFLAETTQRVVRGEYIEPGKVPTFAEAAERWFAPKADRRPGYVADMRSRLDKHILPRFGHERLDRITVAAIEKLRDDLRKDYAPATVRQIVQIMGGTFRAAIRRGECSMNPVERIEHSFTAARELTGNDGGSDDGSISPDSILNPEETRAMLHAVNAGVYKALFTTAALTGARSGELFALRWADIEMPKNGSAYIYIRRTVTWARVGTEKIRPRYFPPKTRAGVRKIPIADELAAVLKVWKLQCPPTAEGLVFVAADGSPIRRSNALRCGLWSALRRAGLRRVNIHSLRHSFASALIARGAAVTEVQHLLGHASPAITLKIYSHWFSAADSGAVGDLSRAILGNDVGTATKWALSGHQQPAGLPAIMESV